MISSKLIALFSLVAVVFLIQQVVVVAVPNLELLYYSCGSELGYTDAFGRARDALNSYIARNTYARGRNLYSHAQHGYLTVYGHGTCGLHLSGDDCATCLESSRIFLLQHCPRSIAAVCQLVDCRLRFKDTPFNRDG
ncbi:hypothetical protein MLD38_029821 [Melastoma candidum]|uniref:Uncharacterized protein n=1 Tax=Melastoma candidum TaxID=119954 RepID=A0ACB9N5B1_9MYRT|nr:hypothetical protein MLD38_029821 [Melastoma candidum]